MSEPSDVAELIGWQQAGKDEWYTWAYRKSDGEYHSPDFGPSVDDLLAWLRTDPVPGWTFYDISAWSGLASEPEPHPHVMLAQNDRETVQFHGATLFEALEAAVRKITS